MDRGAQKWWTLGAVATAVFMLLLDITVVNVALPDIARDLKSTFTDLQWVVDAYALALASLLLTAGSLADRVGRKRIFVAGLVIFTGASLACGLAGSPNVLNVSRAVQGIGGAAMFATSLALVAQEFRGKERGIAFGVLGAATGAALAVGPLIGGALTSGLSWRWIFFVNVPIGIVAAIVSMMQINESRDPAGGRIDWGGFVTFSAALFLLVYALIRGNDNGWTSTTILLMLAGSVVLLAAFVFVERAQEHPMFDLGLLRNKSFLGVSLVAFALSFSLFAMFLYLTLYIQNVLHYSPFQAGLRFLPVTLLSFLVAPIAGRLSATIPARAFLTVGLLFVSLSLYLMSGLTVSSGWTALLIGFIFAGLGSGIMNPPLASAAISVVPPERAGMASGANSTFRQVGIATGIAAWGAIFQHHIQTTVSQTLQGVPGVNASAVGHSVASGGTTTAIASAPAASRGIVAHAAKAAFVGGLNELFMAACGVALVSALIGFALIRTRDFVDSSRPAEAEAVPG
jgi:EmrB/QacA subfamily drug resistance transporter